MKSHLTALLAAVGLALGVPAPALAQAPAYPAKPIHIVVTFPPGGSSDAVVRMVAPRLGERLGQQMIIENRPGAGGNIGLTAVAQAAPDGYTLGLGAAGALAANASLYTNMPFDPIADFAPISLLSHIPFVLVANPGTSIGSVRQLVEAARAQPGKLTVGHGGNGTAMHLSVELLKQLADVNVAGIAYKGNGPATVDVLGGQVQTAMLDLPSALQHIRAGKLRALAVTSAERLPALPDVPTMAEAGVPGYESTGWFGFVAPAGTPAPIVDRLQADINAVLTDPHVREQVDALGVALSPTTSAAFGEFIKAETSKWARVIEISGTRLD